MKLSLRGPILAMCALALAVGPARADTITYQVTNLGGGQFQYDYTVTGSFIQYEAFAIFFDESLFTNLEDPPPAVNSDWLVLTLQPDPGIPAPGEYDGLALVDNPSLADTFSVTFTYIGAGLPGAQPFEVDQYDQNFDFLGTVETGMTSPAVVGTPEPSPILLLLTAILGAGLAQRISRKKPSRSNVVQGIAILVLFAGAGPAFGQLTIGNYQVQSSVRATLTAYNYTFQANVTNTGPAVPTVSADLGILPPAAGCQPMILISGGTLHFGAVAANATVTSMDAFTIQINRTCPFDPTKLQWAISTASDGTITLNLDSHFVQPNLWQGTVSAGFPGELNVAVQRTQENLPVESLTGTWVVTGAPFSFVASLTGTYRTDTLIASMQGVVTSGYMQGHNVSLNAQLVSIAQHGQHFRLTGTFQIAP